MTGIHWQLVLAEWKTYHVMSVLSVAQIEYSDRVTEFFERLTIVTGACASIQTRRYI